MPSLLAGSDLLTQARFFPCSQLGFNWQVGKSDRCVDVSLHHNPKTPTTGIRSGILNGLAKISLFKLSLIWLSLYGAPRF